MRMCVGRITDLLVPKGPRCSKKERFVYVKTVVSEYNPAA